MKKLNLGFVLVILGASALGFSHELKSNTARVELRDNHLRVILNVALLDWLTQVLPGKAGEPASFEASDIPERLDLGRKVLQEQTRLVVNGQRADIKILEFPKVDDVRAVMEGFVRLREAAVPLPHAFGWYQIHLEGIPQGAIVRDISTSFPPSLGFMGVTLVEPVSKWTQPGEMTSFKVDLREDEVPSFGPLEWTALLGGGWFLGFGFLLFLVGLGWRWFGVKAYSNPKPDASSVES
ncbi:MAG: hypothetical protein VYA34_09100 [Myxococcota bacterium]|nr:hypothetical protein [Myxococcota bacterium]